MNKTCRVFALNKTRHPLTKRKFVSKNGVYAQIEAMCLEHAKKTQGSDTWGQKIVDILVNNRDKSMDARIAFKKVMGDFLAQAASVCLEPGNSPLIRDKAGNPLLYFDHRIGGNSTFGVAYAHTGRGHYLAPKFASKIMEITKNNAIEVAVLRKMTAAVVAGYTPNFPIMYSVRKCLDAPTKPHFMVLSELADMDVETWTRRGKHSVEEWASVLMQMILAVFAIHELGYIHNDVHFGNFLIHEIPPGGYWRYDLRSSARKVFVKNAGFLVVLWDMGLCEKYDSETPTSLMWNDYARFGHPNTPGRQRGGNLTWKGYPPRPKEIYAFMRSAMMRGARWDRPRREEIEYVYGLASTMMMISKSAAVITGRGITTTTVINKDAPYLLRYY